MKNILHEYYKITMYTLFGILFVMSTYIIILNVHHYKSLHDNIVVSEIDNDYTKYKDNITEIEDILKNKINNKSELYHSLVIVVNNLKKGGVFRLVPNTKLSYKDLYDLNDFFIEELINNNWVHYLNQLNVSNSYQDTIAMVINNAIYLNSVFTNNSLILYDSNLDNKINDNYHFLLKNYLMYSNILLDIFNKLEGNI